MLVALALTDGTSVGTLVIPVWLMLSQQPRLRRIPLYLAVLAGFYFSVGLVILIVAESAGWFQAFTPGAGWSWVQLVIGIVLLAFGLLIDRRTARSRTGSRRIERWRSRVGRPLSARGVCGLALAVGLLELVGMLPFLAATGIVARSAPAPAIAGVILAGYVVVMVLPALVLLAVRALLADRAAPVLARLEALLERHADAIVGTVLIVVGGLLALDAATRLDLFPSP